MSIAKKSSVPLSDPLSAGFNTLLYRYTGSNSNGNSNGNSAGTSINWEAVHGLMEDAIYGGRIDNAFDLRVLRSYLRYDEERGGRGLE